MEAGPTLEIDAAEQYFGTVLTDEIQLDGDDNVTGYTVPDLSDVDLVLVGMDHPNSEGQGYDEEKQEYIPISLQYRPYTADSDSVRKTSLAGTTLEDGTKENRSYFGKTAYTSNEADLDALERAAEAIEESGIDVPIITVLKARGPIVVDDFEQLSDAIVVGFDVSQAALIEVALGLFDSTGRLPMTFPANMEVVEASFEDVSGDTAAYQDAAGHEYAFGFGLTCEGTPVQ